MQFWTCHVTVYAAENESMLVFLSQCWIRVVWTVNHECFALLPRCLGLWMSVMKFQAESFSVMPILCFALSLTEVR